MDGQPSGDVRLDGAPSAAAVEALELLALPARQVRLLTAIHEAGHAVVGHTLNMPIERIVLTDDGTLDAHTTIPASYGYAAGETVPLPDLLTLRAAGFQAMFQWLDSRELETADRNKAINYLAAGDNTWCKDFCAELAHDATMQDGVIPAGRILLCRWPTVMRMAYALAAAGSLDLFEITQLLWADRQGCTESAERYRRWRDEETAARWYRQPALTTPAALQSSSRSSS